jgi:hypothetical protein
MCRAIASQFIRYYLPGFVLMFLQQSFKESLSCRTIPTFLEKHINNFAVPKSFTSLTGQAFLINCSPEVMLLTIDLYENFVDEKCIAISPVFSLQPSGIFGAKLIAPQSDRLVGNIYSALR